MFDDDRTYASDERRFERMFEFLSKPIVLKDIDDAHVQEQEIAVLVHCWYASPVG